MVVRKEKKIRKKRGHRTAGYGGQKKHRGGGSKGGKGNAGLHKHKVMKMIKYYPENFGKRGFKRPYAKKTNAINIDELNKIIENMIKENKIKKENIKINLNELGYDKLLGNGKIKYKMEIQARSISKNAIKKLEENGCKITVG